MVPAVPAVGSARIRYVVDTRASQFTVQAFASGLIAAVAHSPKIAIREWTGEAVFVAGELETASLRVQVKAASLEVLDELRDADRREIHRIMNQEVLETPRYSEVVYESTQVQATRLKDDLYRLDVKGSLALHGVENEHTIVAQVALGPDTARAYGEFTLRQTDYGIRVASIAGGSLKLQDELKFSFYVVARKQE